MSEDHQPTTEQREEARAALRVILQLLRSHGLRRALFPDASETFAILRRGGYGYFISPADGRGHMWKISKHEIIQALKYW